MKKKLNLLLVVLTASCLFLTNCKREEGCRDPKAINYNADAKKACDVCCEYKEETNNDIPTVVVSGFIETNTTWSADTVYELASKVIVKNGITLTIKAGTIIKGRTGSGTLATALIISRGGKIMAEGTATEPIIFTSVLDDIEPGQIAGSNLEETDNGKWGGLIVLGKAPISAADGDDEAQIEGIPAEESYGTYGGTNAADNSGIIKYVSIRFGGALIGEGNEINGLTLGGVGSGTTIDYVEIVSNLDDGIEFFGGTVNVSNLLIGFQGDDGIDIDQNYSGTVDNAMVIHGIDTDEGFELDGPEGTLNNGVFTLKNITVKSIDGKGSGADIKDKTQGIIQDCTFEGYASKKYLKIRSKFSDTVACSESSDAHKYYTTPSGSQSLTISGNEFITSEATITDVYTTSCLSCSCANDLDAAFETAIDANNATTTTVTKGADKTKFTGWTWMSEKGKL